MSGSALPNAAHGTSTAASQHWLTLPLVASSRPLVAGKPTRGGVGETGCPALLALHALKRTLPPSWLMLSPLNVCRPLVLGRRAGPGGDEWCVASEDCAFGPIGFERVRDVRPGEMIVVTESGGVGPFPPSLSFRLLRPVLKGAAPPHLSLHTSPERSPSLLPAKGASSAWCSTAVSHECLLPLHALLQSSPHPRAQVGPYIPDNASVARVTNIRCLLHLQGSSSRSSATPAHSCAPASLSTSTCRAPTPCSMTSQSTTSSWGSARAWQSASGGPCCELHLHCGVHVTAGCNSKPQHSLCPMPQA